MNLARPRRRGPVASRAAATASTSTTSAPRWTPAPACWPISSVEFASGFRNDLDALGELCRERGVFFFVDAIQALGVFPLDVQQTPIDALAADGHKWLLGPEGAGIAYVRREWVERLHADRRRLEQRGQRRATSRTIDFTLKPHAGRWEGGTCNVRRHRRPGREPGAAARRRASRTSQRRVLELTDYLCDRARVGRAARCSAAATPGEESGIVSLIDARPRPGRA